VTPRQESWAITALIVVGFVLWIDSINEWVFDEDWTRATYAALSVIVGVNRMFRARFNWSRSCAASIANMATAFYSLVIAWVFASFTIGSTFPGWGQEISQLDGARWLRGPLILQMAFLCIGFWLEHRYEARVAKRFAEIVET